MTLVGKGVCFDTGGLDIKPSSGMLLMKKDMGGAANVLGLASMIMAAGLKVRLRVLIPAVENAISGNAFRPGDVLTEPQGHHRRDRQHRRRGPADPRRRAGAGRRGGAGAAGRHGDADRRGARRARARPAALLHRGRRAGRRTRRRRAAQRPIRCGACRCGSPTTPSCPRRSPTSTTSRPTASPARSPRRCSCSASSRRRRRWAHFDIFAWSPSERPHCPIGGEAQAIRALEQVLLEALRRLSSLPCRADFRLE